MRIAAISIIALCMTAPAAAEEVLYCIDTESTGFKWDKQGNAWRTGFKPGRFTVKVISETKRMISLEENAVPYNCRAILGIDFCTRATGVVFDPINFKGNSYTRAHLFGTPIGGDPNITVSYGTCTKY